MSCPVQSLALCYILQHIWEYQAKNISLRDISQQWHVYKNRIGGVVQASLKSFILTFLDNTRLLLLAKARLQELTVAVGKNYAWRSAGAWHLHWVCKQAHTWSFSLMDLHTPEDGRRLPPESWDSCSYQNIITCPPLTLGICWVVKRKAK